MLYNTVLFLHILGAILMFVAIGITLSAMIAMLHSKKVDAIYNWSAIAVKLDGLLPFSVILILLPGLYLVITNWGWGIAWVNISLIALVAMTFMGPIINLRRLKGILNTAKIAHETNMSAPTAELSNKIRDRVLWNSVSIMTLLAVAIVFIMTVKLELVGTLITMAIAIALGFIVSKALLNKPSINLRTTKTIS